MGNSYNFTASGFGIESVTFSGTATIRVTFTAEPKVVSPSAPDDGLNISNYTLTGPKFVTITLASIVPGDPQSIDLDLNIPLAAGTWTISVANILTNNGYALTSPTSWSFLATSIATEEPVSQGAINDDAAALIRKFFNSAFQGNAWDAIITSLATGDATNVINAQAAFDQLFKSSASGLYLDRKLSDDGIIRPSNLGISDALFSKLGITLSTSKITLDSILEVLEIFYGIDTTRANIISTDEIYNLKDGYTLNILMDNNEVDITFSSEDFTQINQATAQEVATVITRELKKNNLTGFALSIPNPITGLNQVRIYSGSIGLKGSIKIIGGTAQRVLLFPTNLDIYSSTWSSSTWNVTLQPGNVARYTLVVSGNPDPDLGGIEIGDYVIINDLNFSSGNRGSFEIINVYRNYISSTWTVYFEVNNTDAIAENTITQSNKNDILFFRPTLNNIYSLDRQVVIARPDGKNVDITIPTTAQVINRGKYIAAYGQANDAINISSLTRDHTGLVTVTTSTNHGLSAGQWVFIDGVEPINGASGGSEETSIASSNGGMPYGNIYGGHTLTLLNDGRVLAVGGYLTSAANTNPTNANATWDGTSWTNHGDYGDVNNHIAVILPDQTVYIAGGMNTGSSVTNYYIFNPNSNTFTGPFNSNEYFTGATGTLLNDGRVLIAGGGGNPISTVQNTCWFYNYLLDPHVAITPTPAITAAPNMNIARINHTAIKLSDGRVLVIGGRSTNASALIDPSGHSGDTIERTAEIYDPNSNTWTLTGKMLSPRSGAAAVLLDDGRVLVVGGYTTGGATNSPGFIEIFDPNSNRWSFGGYLHFYGQTLSSVLHANGFAIKLNNGKVLIGGDNTALASGHISGYEYWNGSSKTTLFPIVDGSTQIVGGRAVLLNDGNILFIGGEIAGSAYSGAHKLISFASDTTSANGLNGLVKIISVTSNTLTYQSETLSYTSASTGTVAAVAAAPETIPGPYIYDVDSGFAITSASSTITGTLLKDNQYNTVTLADASKFPDSEGYVVFSFGLSEETGPVKYIGKESNSLILDYSYKFPNTIPSNSSITLLALRGPYVPEHPELVGSFYVTDSSAARISAQSTLNGTIAAGINYDISITYPGDRGLGGEGKPTHGAAKLSDIVEVFGGNNLDTEIEDDRNS